MNVIHIYRLTRNYDKVRGIENLNGKVKSGKIFSLLGLDTSILTLTFQKLAIASGIKSPKRGL